jgi:inorganic pyrophosphatase
VDLERLPAFVEDDVFHVVVESPRGSGLKLKYSSTLEAFTVSRPLPLGHVYPYDWGFVPSTKGEDGDPIDAAIAWDVASFPGVVVPCRALALVMVEQNRPGGSARVRNDRILAIPVEERRTRGTDPAAAIGDRLRAEIDLFFTTAAALEGKDARVIGWDSASAALQLLHQSVR